MINYPLIATTFKGMHVEGLLIAAIVLVLIAAFAGRAIRKRKIEDEDKE